MRHQSLLEQQLEARLHIYRVVAFLRMGMRLEAHLVVREDSTCLHAAVAHVINGLVITARREAPHLAVEPRKVLRLRRPARLRVVSPLGPLEVAAGAGAPQDFPCLVEGRQGLGVGREARGGEAAHASGHVVPWGSRSSGPDADDECIYSRRWRVAGRLRPRCP